MAVYDKLCAIVAENPGYLAAYTDDLHKHDKAQLATAKAGTRFVWVLRTSGTVLFEISSGMVPLWCTYWLNPHNICDGTTHPSLPFLVQTGRDGSVQAISVERAIELAETPHPLGKKIVFSLS